MPAATRVGDNDVPHCSGMTRAQGSTKTFVNGIKWSCQNHRNTTHLLPGDPCPSHSAPITNGSRSVFIEGRGAGRVGDALTGCTSVAAGSPNVFVGDSGGNNKTANSSSAAGGTGGTPTVTPL